MVSIARTCDMVGVARSTLLYYERIGIISPKRNPENGYRDYSGDDIHALVLIRQLQKAGFSLKEADAVMKGELDPDLMLDRFQMLEQDIRELTTAREVVKSLVIHATGKEPETADLTNPAGHWHAELEKTAGEAHEKWLKRLGFDDKEQLYIRWVTRTLTDSEGYMKDFFTVFEQMKRQGPGSRASTTRGFNAIPDNHKIKSILEIGCGKGQSGLTLSRISEAKITAIDNHQPFLDHFKAQVGKQGGGGCGNRIRIKNMSMTEMDFPDSGFDLIWSEGSAYFMGFQKALAEWKSLLRPGGYLFVSDAVWLTDQPSPPCCNYFRIEYPGMTDPATRKNQARDLGYDIADEFLLPRQDWTDFYDDMAACVARAVEKHGMTRAFAKMTSEIEVGRTFGAEYGCLCLLLKPVN
ncbi:MAG: MerR family transcriptional regulator [Desulfobacterales bacterium]|nr:MerR family transcriptional regulator [Desulfobacterales bacterium]